MNINGVMRLGRLELRVFDLEKSVDYYSNIIGLDVMGRMKTESISKRGMSMIIIA